MVEIVVVGRKRVVGRRKWIDRNNFMVGKVVGRIVVAGYESLGTNS